MALIEYGPLICNAVGGLADVVFARCRQGPTVRTKPTVPDAQTLAEIRCRNGLNAISKAWGTLTKTQQAEWSTAAQAHPSPNKLGQYFPLSGFNFFCSLNLNRYFAGQVLLTTPPTDWTWAPIMKPMVTATQAPTATTALTASWNQFSEVPAQIVVEATPATPWGQQPQRHQLRFIATFAPDVTLPQSIETDWQAIYGNLPFNVPYQILFRFTPYNQATGVPGSPAEYVLSIGGSAPTPPPHAGTSITTPTILDESLNYYFTNASRFRGFYGFTLSPGITYTITYVASDTNGDPTLTLTNPTTGNVTQYQFGQQDTATLTAITGDVATFQLSGTPSPTTWSLMYSPTQIAAAAVWACGTGGDSDAITIYLENGQMWQQSTPSQPAGLSAITIDRLGNVWGSEVTANNIAVMSSDGIMQEFALPTANANPGPLVEGPDGNIWVTELNGNNIAQCTPTGTITEFAVPTPAAAPGSFASGQTTRYGSRRKEPETSADARQRAQSQSSTSGQAQARSTS